MIKFTNELEVNFWMNIYSKGAGNDDIYHDGDPAAETADKAIRSLRKRMPAENQPTGSENTVDTESYNRSDGNYHNSPNINN